MSTLKAMLIGAAAAVVFVGVLVLLAAMNVAPVDGGRGRMAQGPVAVALVLPEAGGGTSTLRLLDLYQKSGQEWTVQSVSPSTTVIVSGTGGTTLADAYGFGGGDGLVDALENQMGYPPASWVIVDEAAWARLRNGASVEVTLTSDVEVFDGKRLYSFPKGATSVPPTETAEFMDGVPYLGAVESAGLRAEIGDALGSSLASAGPTGAAILSSSARENVLAQWLGSLASRRRIPAK